MVILKVPALLNMFYFIVLFDSLSFVIVSTFAFFIGIKKNWTRNMIYLNFWEILT